MSDYYQQEPPAAVQKPLRLRSVLQCPHCGFKVTETMPTTSCVFFYECQACRKMLRPRAGDGCVFCSYGTVECPCAQRGECTG